MRSLAFARDDGTENESLIVDWLTVGAGLAAARGCFNTAPIAVCAQSASAYLTCTDQSTPDSSGVIRSSSGFDSSYLDVM